MVLEEQARESRKRCGHYDATGLCQMDIHLCDGLCGEHASRAGKQAEKGLAKTPVDMGGAPLQ
jgi:hypothetical protein